MKIKLKVPKKDKKERLRIFKLINDMLLLYARKNKRATESEAIVLLKEFKENYRKAKPDSFYIRDYDYINYYGFIHLLREFDVALKEQNYIYACDRLENIAYHYFIFQKRIYCNVLAILEDNLK